MGCSKVFGGWYHYITHRFKGVPHSVLASAGKGLYCGREAFFRPGEDIRIGENVFIGHHVHIAAPCTIKDHVMLASYVSLVGGDHNFSIPGVLTKMSGRSKMPHIIIEEDVWIGHGSIILVGVRIGQGAVIAAGSIVTKHVPPCTIWGSPPAGFLRARFETEEQKLGHLAFLKECSDRRGAI